RARVRVAATGHSLVRHSDDRFPKSTVDVPPGAERIEWQLDARPVSLTIFAVDEADKPIRDVRIRAGPWPRTEFGDGRVGFGERKYAVVIGATRYEDRAIAPSEWKDRESLTVTLRRAADLRGRVLDADGAPVAEASARTSYSHREYTDGDGRFRLSRVAAGETAEVVVEVDGWPARTVPIVAGGPEVTVRLSPRGSIRIRFPRERGTGPEQFVVFGGTVSDGTVWIESESYTSRLFAQEDPEGLTLSVPVGARNLWLRVPPGLPRHYLGLHVAPGETVGVEYDFPKLGRLVGTVTDPSGNPVVDASVYLDGPDFEIATTDEEGRFRMDPGEIDWDSMDISVGPWPLVVSSDEFAPHVTPSVDLTQDRDLSIRVQKGGHLSGRVVPAADYFAIEVAGVLRSHISFMLTREKGSFRSLTPIPPGRQRIIFTLPRGRVMERTVTIQAGEVTTVVVDAN
ncbi:MAG: carboxypeptidase-like regulatory domain-containing protein, partial [Planctomycetota bacterium]